MRNQQNKKNRRGRRPGFQDDKLVVEDWKPRTRIGKAVKAGKITSMGYILDNGMRLLEPEIADVLMPNLESDLLMIGQAKGKFGGGKRRVFRQTQKKTAEGNSISFGALAVVGNKDGYVGVGEGKAKETVPAREKAIRNAKLNMIKIARGSGSWLSDIKMPHSIPFKVTGKAGSVEITLIPAPPGTGLCVEKECQKILKLAGVEDIWSKTKGQTKVKFNLIRALMDALSQLVEVKVQPHLQEELGYLAGSHDDAASKN